VDAISGIVEFEPELFAVQRRDERVPSAQDT
jgi:hypothetical protein